MFSLKILALFLYGPKISAYCEYDANYCRIVCRFHRLYLEPPLKHDQLKDLNVFGKIKLKLIYSYLNICSSHYQYTLTIVVLIYRQTTYTIYNNKYFKTTSYIYIQMNCCHFCAMDTAFIDLCARSLHKK